MRDNISNVQYVNLGSLTLSGTTPGLTGYLDTRGFDAASIVLVNGTITAAGTAGFTATLQDSADTAGSSAATATELVSSGTITVTADTDDDVVAGAVGYAGSDRYIGLSVVGTTNTDAVVTAIGVLSKPSAAATTLVGAVVART